MYEVAIIGSGPAGISAALTLKNLNKNFVLFGSQNLSDKVLRSQKITNYAGVNDVSGTELVEKFKKQLSERNIEVTEKRINNVFFLDGKFMLLSGDEIIEAKSVIFAGGTESVKAVRGEAELLGKGVSYCATCDGFLYKGKDIVIVTESPKFEHEVEFLRSLAASARIYRLYDGDRPLSKINGETQVTSVEDGYGNVVAADGVFLLKNSISAAKLISGVKTENGAVVVDRAQKTTLNGCFAAGDCTGTPYQIAKAVGEGNVAAHSSVAYLSDKK